MQALSWNGIYSLQCSQNRTILFTGANGYLLCDFNAAVENEICERCWEVVRCCRKTAATQAPQVRAGRPENTLVHKVRGLSTVNHNDISLYEKMRTIKLPTIVLSKATISAEVCSRCWSATESSLALLAVRRCSSTMMVQHALAAAAWLRCYAQTRTTFWYQFITKPYILTNKVLFTGWKEAQVPWILDLCCWRHTVRKRPISCKACNL
jgi:hypothetical protein